MKWGNLIRRLSLVACASVLVAACGGTSTGTTSCTAKTATSAADCGGISGLAAAAKAEGKLTIIATPPDWANYGEIISTFESKYSVKITSLNPNGSSQEEIDAFDGTSRAPDVVDITQAVALKNTALFAPYKVATWSDIPDSAKEPSGLWFNDYGGYMGIGYDSAKVGTISSIQDLLGSKFRSTVALSGDPTISGQALNGVIMASVANGGSLDDMSKGVDFFHKLKQAGNYVNVIATNATVKAGQTPVIFQWDYLSASHGKDIPGWKIFVPANAVVGGYYNAAINKQAPHPAAARLWEEYVFSDAGQNMWLKGGARPVRQPAMTKAGTVNAAAAAALPAVPQSPLVPTGAQSTAAFAYLNAHWSQAIS